MKLRPRRPCEKSANANEVTKSERHARRYIFPLGPNGESCLALTLLEGRKSKSREGEAMYFVLERLCALVKHSHLKKKVAEKIRNIIT